MSKRIIKFNWIGVLGLLTIVFIVLKLTNVIDWSWWWVTAPLWGNVLFNLLLVVAGAVMALISKNKNNETSN